MENKTQKELFEENLSIANKISSLGRYIQNDFNWVIQNGSVDKKEIKEQSLEFKKEAVELMDELKENLNSIYGCMKQYSK
jgi:hypothetical protein